MNNLILFLFIIPLCQGRPLHSEKSKSSSKNSAPEKSQGRQYVSQSQQTQGVAGNPQTYGQYPPSYAGAVQNQYGQQQYDQQPQQQQQQMAGQSPNKGHTGALYSYRPVVDHDKDISPPENKKGKKTNQDKKKHFKSKKDDDDEEK